MENIHKIKYIHNSHLFVVIFLPSINRVEVDVRLILVLGPPAVLRLEKEVNPLFPWWVAVVAARKSSNGKWLKPKGEKRDVAILFEAGWEWRPDLLRWFPWPFKPAIQNIIM